MNATKAIRQVLKEASNHERFFDFSDCERLTWMIKRAYELGQQAEKESYGSSSNRNRDGVSDEAVRSGGRVI